MRLGGRVAAAIEVLDDIEQRKRPASAALKDWGLSHRFAGSGDRAAIGNLVYDVLRRKKSLGFLIGSDGPRCLVLSNLVSGWKMTAQEISQEFHDDKFAPDCLSESETAALAANDLKTAADDIRADIPQWCAAGFEANFADDWITEAAAFGGRPPLDMRVNALKSTRDKVMKQLKRTRARQTSIARYGLRIEAGTRDSRLPNVQADEAFQKGRFEIQDEGSQIVADLVFAQPGENVLDYCAGSGGKTLAMASTMQNKGQIHAFDNDKHRLAPIHERLRRAGTRNVQVHAPDSDLSPLVGKMDKVIVDAPCTGSGTWRRRPDAKWRLDPNNLEQRLHEQEEAMSGAAPYVRPGGFLVYITCSVFPEENEHQIYGFIEDNPQFELVSAGEVWEELFGLGKLTPWSSDMKTITLTPAATDTDGFFFAVMARHGQGGKGA